MKAKRSADDDPAPKPQVKKTRGEAASGASEAAIPNAPNGPQPVEIAASGARETGTAPAPLSFTELFEMDPPQDINARLEIWATEMKAFVDVALIQFLNCHKKRCRCLSRGTLCSLNPWV